MPAGKITISYNDIQSSAVERRLAEQREAAAERRGPDEAPAETRSKTSFWYHAAVYLSLFGLLGGGVGWALGELVHLTPDAREQSAEQQQRTAALLHDHLKQVDLVVTTAQIPGRPAPKLITEAMVADMRPGTVIVDLAAETGGNCALTRPGEIVDANGVLVFGAVDIPSSVPTHASQMFGRNVLTLLQHLIKDGAVKIELTDEITGPMCVVYQGQPRS